MTWKRTVLLALISAALPLALVAAQDAKPKPKPPLGVASCAKVTAHARYEAYGYTHVIELQNTCDKPVICSVWTDVDPAKVTLRAEPGTTESLVTRKGSPARAVAAQSECTLAK